MGLTSGLAPESRTAVGRGGVGHIEAIEGRLTPGMRPMWMAPAAIAAPVDPAEMNPAAAPVFSCFAATDTVALGFSQIARPVSSCMPMNEGAWTLGKDAPNLYISG